MNQAKDEVVQFFMSAISSSDGRMTMQKCLVQVKDLISQPKLILVISFVIFIHFSIKCQLTEQVQARQLFYFSSDEYLKGDH